MELREDDPIPPILERLRDRLDLSTVNGQSYYNKAYSVINLDIKNNGTPSDERAYHLCCVAGIPANTVTLFSNNATLTIDGEHYQVTKMEDLPSHKPSKNKPTKWGKRFY